MKKIVLIGTYVLLSSCFSIDESQKTFCLDNGRCITVWKSLNDVCYIIPGKYSSLNLPIRNSYIQTSNTNDVDIIWPDSSENIIVNTREEIKINDVGKDYKIEKYSQDPLRNDSMFMTFDGKYHRYKSNVSYISLHIKEFYAIDNNGKRFP